MHEHVLHAGSFLVVPCGQYKQTADSPTLFTAYVYARGHWAQPFLRLPATNKVNRARAFWMCHAVSPSLCHSNQCMQMWWLVPLQGLTSWLLTQTEFQKAGWQRNLAIPADLLHHCNQGLLYV